MIIRHPENKDICALKTLWKEAFNDSENFIDGFFKLSYSKKRSMIIEKDNKVASMLYWFDCNFNGNKVAYVYAVATSQDFRKQGLCNSLMEALHSHLKAWGYVGACLVPSSDILFNFYAKMGYIKCIHNSVATITPSEGKMDIKKISAEEYIKLRKDFLPLKAITQNDIDFSNFQLEFFKGDDFIFSSRKENNELFVPEFWGNKNVQPNIVYCQNAKKGIFRTAGTEKPFAMFLPFIETELPEYLDYAYD